MELKKTITSIFMVPTLKIGKEGLFTNGFLNAYSKDSRREVQHENCIYLLFKPKNIEKFKDFLDNEYRRTTKIIEDYDYENGFIVAVYELDKKFEEDFNLVRQGKYSQTSKEFQDSFDKVVKIVKRGKHQDELSLQVRIFNKTSDLREYWENKLNFNFSDKMEVWDGWDEEKETLDLDKIKELV